MRICTLIAALALSLTFLLHQARAEDQKSSTFTADQRATIEQFVHDYLLSHPEILRELAQKAADQEQQEAQDKMQQASAAVKPVDAQDHLRGDPKAPVRIVEYSDFECPFCKSFHPTLKQVFDEYGKTGKVAWVYRHFPLDELHSKARKEAQAAECAGEIGGNDAFWAFADKLFEIAPSNNRLDLSLLPKIASDLRLDRVKFEACLSGNDKGGKFADHIEADYQNAVAAGGAGTPYSVVIAANGKTFPINGAMPVEEVRSIIDLALAEK